MTRGHECRVCLIFCQYLMIPNIVGGELTFYNFWEQFGHSELGGEDLEPSGGRDRQSHLASDLSIKVTCYKVEQPGQGEEILITARALAPCLHRLIMMIHSSHDTASSSSTKHISNEAKQSSTGPGQRLSLEEIQSFVKSWQLDRVN